MLAIGRALMARPRLLLLDEPAMGLAPMIVKEIFKNISQLCSDGTTILLVEQNAREALKISNYVYVMATGTLAADGRPKELLHDKRIRKAYLG